MYLTRYEPPPALEHGDDRIYLFDAGRGEMIAELDETAVAAIRAATHGPVRLTFNGRTETVQVES